ncbi:MAG: tRNA 4-thiouridine(8) synthase ThiI [Oscillospiraceae bacterium]|nr:tRNA 4-thiouridine(8) synthase ThiI [Oscillospiraceae bacterium]
MVEDVVLVRPGEIVLKGLNKGKFVAALRRNIMQKLQHQSVFLNDSLSTFVIKASAPETDLNQVFGLLRDVFGISKLERAQFCEKNLEAIKLCCVNLAQKSAVTSFKVNAKRLDKTFLPDSRELCREIGAHVLKFCQRLHVDVNLPELVLRVEIKKEGAYISFDSVPGAGGLPVGCSGGGNVLLSGGIDSPVAAFLMAKRGLRVRCTHFETPPYTSELARIKVEDLVQKLTKFCGKITLHTIEFTYIQEQIRKLCPQALSTIIMRRFMLRIAQNIAISHGDGALVTGESLGQVASQTASAINCTNAVCTLPVFRPLIGFDKQEIVAIACKIKTFEISAAPHIDCCSLFSSKHPRTNPVIAAVLKAEQPLIGPVLQKDGESLQPNSFLQMVKKFDTLL